MNERDMDQYFSGQRLYGDDFSLEEIKQWHEEETEGYANLGNKHKDTYTYDYHALNIVHGFNHIKDIQRFDKALGIGSAWGLEFEPIIDKINSLTIVEPSDHMVSHKIGNITPHYSKPAVDGKLGFDDNTFDLITAFGVLHHIPNVTFVFDELVRVLRPNGVLLVREPVVTQGDWRKPRPGVTKNERGIPVEFFENLIKKNDLQIVKKTNFFCGTSFITRLLNRVTSNYVIYAHKYYIVADKYLSKLLKWNMHYHPKGAMQKAAPDSIYYVLKKKGDGRLQ